MCLDINNQSSLPFFSCNLEACSSYILTIWGDASYLQALHLTIALGATVAPLLAEPFLSERGRGGLNMANTSASSNTTYGSISGMVSTAVSSQVDIEDTLIVRDSLSPGNNTAPDKTPFDTWIGKYPRHVYPYLIISIFNLAVVILFVTLIRRQQRPLNTDEIHVGLHVPAKGKEANTRGRTGTTSLSRWERRLLIILFILLMLFHGGIETTYGGLVLTYAVNHLSWTKSMGTMVASAFWGALASGRCAGIFISKLGHLRLNLAISVTTAAVSMAVLAVAASLHHLVLWICSIVLGVSISMTVGNSLVVAKQFGSQSGRLVSMLIFGLFAGMLLLPAVTGRLFKTAGVVCFPYVIAIAASLMVTVYITIQVVIGRKLTKNGETKVPLKNAHC